MSQPLLRARRVACALATLSALPAARPAALLAQGATAQGAARRPMTFADFAAVQAVSDPQLSPDGRHVLYAVRTTDVAGNRRTTTTYLAETAGDHPAAIHDGAASEARWSPDGRWIAYVAGGQLWIRDVEGRTRRQVTRLNGGATGPVWSPTGGAIVFTSTVWPECTTGGNDDACNRQRDSVKAASKVQAYTADRLLYRHWTSVDAGTRNHLFAVAIDGQGNAGAPRDLVPGAGYDVPPGPFGGSEGYAVSPDGQEVAFSAKAPTRDEAWSTDVNLYVVPMAGGAPTVLTAANAGADQNPVYTPDGKHIAYASQRRAKFESDRWRLMLLDRATRQSRELLTGWDRNADAYVFAPDMSAAWVTTGDRGRDKLFRVALRDGRAAGAPQLVIGDHNNVAFSFSRDRGTVAWLRDAANRPAEVYVASTAGAKVEPRQLTQYNVGLVSQLALAPAEDFWFRGADGDSVHGFVVRPPNWQAGRKYPGILLIHGGPQGAWLDQWHGRWNYNMLAAPGFALIVVNPRGSTGYGQRFVDQVTGDWGGRAYTDLMRGMDAALAKHPWIDRTRMGATGGSYGGYMTNWIATHAPEKFRALATHAGIWNLENMYGATEEIWFTEWEMGGPYWDPKAMQSQYRRWSPHLGAARLKTPQLVLHGEIDYRVPYYEGVSLFTALQRQNVPSRLVVFPDEGHWIGKPQNQQLWWKEMQGWFTKYLQPADAPRTAM
ncbi:S9 family peptidase [Roseisolibacter agri]|uniref:Prolyl oligopeptidase n=1 Tax=Roseisolibacter agri TaxID=2014610 RepID=A0AA37Q3V7_9BACT|nr:S9 family peptidase [Roseisolibacter agri]GLC24142.1 prolyl oligopeptidase [Roseisolibacter agri]